MSLTIADLEPLQQEHPDWQMELVEGNIIVMGPSDYESDEISIRFAAKLWNWVEPRRLGRVTGSSAGFILPRLTTVRRKYIKQLTFKEKRKLDA